jgi:glycosyltransferase involved in cell wall biosynthesis
MSQKIRVAYDISVLAEHFDRLNGKFDNKSGIYRVYEEVMLELSRRDDVDLTAVGLCGDDILLNSLRAWLYVKNYKARRSYRFENGFKSRLGLTKLYRHFLGTHRLRQSRTHRMARRLVDSIKFRFDRIEPYFRPSEYDVFHSPFHRLPAAELTGGTPRLLTIYDLIPINGREFVPPESTVSFQQILDSIDHERDWITCISEFTRKEFCEHTGMSPARVFVTPLAASDRLRPVTDEGRLAEVRRLYGIPEGDYILSIASIESRRNLAHVIRCFFALLNANPSLDVHLVLAGRKGYMHEEILSVAEASPQFRSRVIFTDYVAEDDLAAIYSGAMFFVYASRYEGFGLPPLEAMQCGVPVITSNSTSIPEVVGDAGIMVDPSDADALTHAMLSLLTSSELRQELRCKGLKRAESFSWAKCAADTAAVYHKIVDSR